MTSHLTDVTTRRPIAPGRRAWGAWAAVVLLLAGVAAAVALHSPWLSVREIEIAGAERVDAAGRLTGAGIGPGAIMVWLDTGAAEAAVAADPWAASVRVHREWPDRLVVEVEERVAGLWVEGTGAWMLVASDGTVLDTADEPTGGLLRASVGLADAPVGTRPSTAAWGELTALSGVLAAPLASASTVVVEGGEWWLLTPGHAVRLGHPIDLADKGRVAQVMLDDGLPPGSTLDVVAPRRPAVIPAGVQPGVEPGEGADPGGAVEGEGDGG